MPENCQIRSSAKVGKGQRHPCVVVWQPTDTWVILPTHNKWGGERLRVLSPQKEFLPTNLFLLSQE